MDKIYFAEKIIEWYHQNKRFLPWRDTTDPYKIWISEIILQQTRVAQGTPYYLRFIERFPDISQLAAASEQEILRLWQGLGYYSRARNLHRCAKEVVRLHGGKFPSGYNELLALPGIGSYTAAAIASIAFKVPVAVLDGNVYRVLARYFGIDRDIALPSSKAFFSDLANSLVPKDHPDEFNQGMMEFGAIHCTPRSPACGHCMLAGSCVAREHGLQGLLPVKSKKASARHRHLTYFVIRKGKKIALQRRDGKDIWHGLYDFYSVESPKKLSAAKMNAEVEAQRKKFGNVDAGAPSPLYKHVLTHQILFASFIAVNLKSGKRDDEMPFVKKLKFYSAAQIQDLPKPVLVSRYLADNGYL